MIKLTVNGEAHQWDGDPSLPLLWYLRDESGLTGTKYGCGQALCGACTVHVGGQAVRSCVTPVSKAAGQSVTTLEGLGTPEKPNRVQAAFIAEQAAQCGYCVSGMVMSGAALLARKANVSRADAQQALAGNLCRCGTHDRILNAVVRASRRSTP